MGTVCMVDAAMGTIALGTVAVKSAEFCCK